MKRVIWAAAVWLACSQAFGAGNVTSGKALYMVCAGCHGLRAEGNQDVRSPKLTALNPAYVARQLRYFQQGVRGVAAADPHGQRMAPFALAIPDERSLDDVLAYLDTLPHTAPLPTVAGDAQRGQQLYAVCSACHGPQGQGVEQLSSPALAGLDDWYVVGQLQMYRSGLRGTHPDDTYGQQMVPIVAMLGDDQVLRDLAAHIATFQLRERPAGR